MVSAKNFELGNLNVLDLNYLFGMNDHIWKTQQWPQDWKRSVFTPIPKKGNAKECSNYRTIALISRASKIILRITLLVYEISAIVR